MDKQNELNRIIKKVEINLFVDIIEYAKLTANKRQKLLLELRKQNAKVIEKYIKE